ncbi:M23 family metallopeptidase [Nocardiopsis xinjiangensis]|uniref:M23 family metallopeptidase n=1 Tax=Nocardiopsis xinjiangensis TaxID=124285 RepID=UPI000344E5C7|nr:M23 family metallopeptidase [Nocardiopsis xinjiangensis]
MGPLTRWLLTFSLLLFPFFPIRTAAAEPPWQWPLDPRPHVLRGFDPPERRWHAGHLGADLAAEVGQPVLASADGVVHFAGTVAGVPVVSVAHGDLRTTYLPVRASTARGDPVLAGDELGTLPAEPAHCASRPCLHFGLLRGAAYLDPLGPLGHGPVRLLPLPGSWRSGPVEREAEVEPTDSDRGAHVRTSGTRPGGTDATLHGRTLPTRATRAGR